MLFFVPFEECLSVYVMGRLHEFQGLCSNEDFGLANS